LTISGFSLSRICGFPANNSQDPNDYQSILKEKRNMEPNESKDSLTLKGTVEVLSKWASSQAELLVHFGMKKADFSVFFN
jgi:hypothetical protein